MDFLGLKNRRIAVFGVANRRSVAFAVGAVLKEAGAECIYIVKDEQMREKTAKLLAPAPILKCDVEREEEVAALATELQAHAPLHGLVHSIAFANYSQGFVAFHETGKEDFLQAMDISCFSLINLSKHLKSLFAPDAAIVTISISTTRMAAENYGYMGPIKAALNSAVVFLAKSLSTDGGIRVNAVGAGLLKTSASAGIPGYVDSYLFAEQVIPRRQALRTEEVADTVAFLLSKRAGGINAQTVIVDAGMSINYFDSNIVRRAMGSDD